MEANEIRELLKVMPKEHPFEYAELCELYYFDDTPTYVSNPAYNAYTYPTYDTDSMSFNWKHYDMEADNCEDDVSRDLVDLIDGFDGDINSEEFINICEQFKVPQEHIDHCLKEYLSNEN